MIVLNESLILMSEGTPITMTAQGLNVPDFPIIPHIIGAPISGVLPSV